MFDWFLVWAIGLFMGFVTGSVFGWQIGFNRGVEATEKRWADYNGREQQRRWSDGLQGKS